VTLKLLAESGDKVAEISCSSISRSSVAARLSTGDVQNTGFKNIAV